MGADLCLWRLQWRKGRTENQTKENLQKVLSKIEKRIHALFENGAETVKGSINGGEYTKDELLEALNLVTDACNNDRRDCATMDVGEGVHQWRIMVTGGETWGDDPTEVFTAGCKFDDLGLLWW